MRLFFFSNFTFTNYTAGKVSEVFIYSIFTLTNLCKRPGCLTETKQLCVKKEVSALNQLYSTFKDNILPLFEMLIST